MERRPAGALVRDASRMGEKLAQIQELTVEGTLLGLALIPLPWRWSALLP